MMLGGETRREGLLRHKNRNTVKERQCRAGAVPLGVMAESEDEEKVQRMTNVWWLTRLQPLRAVSRSGGSRACRRPYQIRGKT